MAKLNVNLRILIPKLSIKYLLFIIIIIIGCSYQIIQLTQVFLKFETKVDVKYDQDNEIVIPIVSFCKRTFAVFRDSSRNSSKGLSPAQFYNQTFSFAEVFIGLKFIISNDEYDKIVNFIDDKQNDSKIHYEKTISNLMICYHFKYLHSKQLKHKQRRIYTFELYHQNYEISFKFPYDLFLTSEINYPNYEKDNPLYIYGNNFFL